MSVYLFIGLLCVSLAGLFFPKTAVIRYLAFDKRKSWINGALIGVPMPLCSCGVIPMAKYFKENGVSKGGLSSFLISTPTTGVDSAFVYYGFLGLPALLVRFFSSFAMGVLGGFFMDKAFPQKDDAPTEMSIQNQTEEKASFLDRAKSSFRYGFFNFLDELHFEILKAIFLTALIMSIISDNNFIFQYLMGGGIVSYLAVIALGLPMYVCATASVPMALALMAKGMSIGTAFVFLSVGPVLSVASIMMLRSVFSPKELVYYILYIVISSIFLGYFVDWLYNAYQFALPSLTPSFSETSVLDYVFSAAFTLLLFIVLYRRHFSRNKQKENDACGCEVSCENGHGTDLRKGVGKLEGANFFAIEGLFCQLKCGNCERSIQEVFKRHGIEVEVSLNEKKLYYQGFHPDKDEMMEIIKESGHRLGLGNNIF